MAKMKVFTVDPFRNQRSQNQNAQWENSHALIEVVFWKTKFVTVTSIVSGVRMKEISVPHSHLQNQAIYAAPMISHAEMEVVFRIIWFAMDDGIANMEQMKELFADRFPTILKLARHVVTSSLHAKITHAFWRLKFAMENPIAGSEKTRPIFAPLSPLLQHRPLVQLRSTCVRTHPVFLSVVYVTACGTVDMAKTRRNSANQFNLFPNRIVGRKSLNVKLTIAQRTASTNENCATGKMTALKGRTKVCGVRLIYVEDTCAWTDLNAFNGTEYATCTLIVHWATMRKTVPSCPHPTSTIHVPPKSLDAPTKHVPH